MKPNNKKTYLLSALFLIFFLLILAFFMLKDTKSKTADIINASQETNQNQNEILIGYVADQSASGTAAMGIGSLNGLEVAVEEINAQGGLLGKKVKIISEDDKADPELSRQIAEDFIFNRKVTAIIGPGNSESALNWIDLAQKNEVPVIIPIATASILTQKYADSPRNYIFRTSLSEIEQVRLGVAWGLNATKNGTIAVVHDSTAYGLSGLQDVTVAMREWGKSPVFVKEFDRGATDEELRQIIDSVKQSGADAIYFYTLADSNIKFVKVLEETEDYDPVIIGSASNLAPQVWDALGPMASKINFSGYIDLTDGIIALRDRIEKKYGSTAPIVMASQAYDAAILLKAAIEEAGSLAGSDITDALEEVENVQGAFKFYKDPFSKADHEMLNARDVFMAHWVDGEIVKIDDNFTVLDIK